MAETKLTTKKRKRPSCTTHPFKGIFTRSKSQIYLHRNRSGQARSDSTRHKNHHSFESHTNKPKKTLTHQHSSNSDDLLMLIKDLRTRRVFPRPLEDNEFETSAKNLDSCFQKQDLVKECLQKADDTNPDLSVLDGNAEVCVDLSEKCVQATPPDAETFGGNLETIGGLQNNDGSFGLVSHANFDTRNNAGNKPVLNPCFRMKLFKTPGSFSYRRLLPYLKDIAKDNSCGPKIGHCLKIEKGLEEKPLQPLLASHCKEIVIYKSKSDNCSIEGNTGDSGHESNSVSIEHISDSRNDFIMGVNSPTPVVHECSSKSIACGGIEEFEIGISSKDQNLDSLNSGLASIIEDSHFNKDSSSGEHYGTTELMDNGETKKIDEEFSCNAQTVNSFGCNLTSIMEKCHSGKDDKGGQCSDDTKKSKTREMEIFNVGDPFKAENLNCLNSSLFATEWHGKSGEQRGDSDGEVLDQIDDSNEECVQATPPDADIFGKPEAVENGGVRVESVLQSPEHVLEKPLDGNGSIHRSSICVDKIRFDSSSSKLVLNRCSQPKLFKTPGSFNYRRLLPFLKDIIKDDSCASGNGLIPKLKNLEEKPPAPLLVSDCQEIPIGNSNGSSCHIEHHAGDICTLPMAISVAAQGSSNNKEESLKSPKHVTESPLAFGLQQERESQVKQNVTDTGRKLEIAHDIVDSVHGSDPPSMSLDFLVSSGSFSREDATLASHQLPVNTQEHCTNSIIKFTNGAALQEPSQLEASVHSGFPAVGSKKGILKRNPRGCRGACTCLNCSSFRLHAERAFEFSRNQMKDAEEAALDLISELSYLRNILEKSAVGVDDRAVISVNQVKEACRKASEAEELAKNRLDKMNYDLDIHCRIPSEQRPRVRFANYVQEKVLPKVDLSSK